MQDATLCRSTTTVGGLHVVPVILLMAAMAPCSLANPVQNPSMEGSFADGVAEHWTALSNKKDTAYNLGDFSENTDSSYVHGGSKSQEIYWYGIWSGIGYDGLAQYVGTLQAGQTYRASFWYKARFSSWAHNQSCDFYGGVGVDPNGGSAAAGWSWHKETINDWWHARVRESPWAKVNACFSANGPTATIYLLTYASGSAEDEYWDPSVGDFRCCRPATWDLHAYIDDVVVEPVAMGAGSTVQATSPVPANGVDRCDVTITVRDDSGQPLEGVLASEIVVACTGSDNTIVGPTSATDANGVATAYITSRVGETKTISVTVFGSLLADTAAVEFTGSFGPFWYVDVDAGGANNGSSWANAFNDLQDALAIAQSGDEIRVAQGTYKPGSGRADTFQLKSGVALRGGYAGFGAPDPDLRDTSAYETVLSGDCNGDDGADFANNSENSYHVVTGSGTDETAVLDGFTITAGNANEPSYLRNTGGGMVVDEGTPTVRYCTFTANSGTYGGGVGTYNASPSLTHCTFSSNQAQTGGGGMACDDGGHPTVTDCQFSDNSSKYGGGLRSHTCDPVVTNCTFSENEGSRGGGVRNMDSNAEYSHCRFTGNSASEAGGGIFNEGSGTVTVVNCTFSGNSAWGGGGIMNNGNSARVTHCAFSDNATDYFGGGIFEYANSPFVANCLFSGNSAGESGGGMAIENGAGSLINCTFSGNSAPGGNAVVCDSEGQPSDIDVTNCILWDGGSEITNNDGSTITITYSDVQGGWPGTGNVNVNPLFVAAASGDCHLSAGSPCIDAGDNSAVPVGVTTDLDGLARFFDDPGTPDTGSGTAPIVDMGAYEYGSSASTVAVYRFWSDRLKHHFYTISEAEKNKLMSQFSATWAYEGPAYRAFAAAGQPGTAAVYRFWSDRYGGHFYTISASEKDKLVAQYSHVWAYEGPAFFAYPDGQQPAGTSPVYRFWSGALGGHFYTISESEKNKLVTQYADVWAYEGIAWHAYE